jgi:hypothetical protein
MIEKNLKNGAYVVVKRGEKYQVFSPNPIPDGDYRRSGWCDSMDETKGFFGLFERYDENLDELAKKENWEVVEIFYGQQPTFKEGDRVKVLETGEVDTIVYIDEYTVRLSNETKYRQPTDLAHAESEEVETITIAGHTYDKKEVEDKLSGLTEIK